MVDPVNLARGFAPAPEPEPMAANDVEPQIVLVEAEGDGVQELGDDGVLTITSPDGSVTVDFAPDMPEEDGDDDFGANLANTIGDEEQRRIVSELLQAIQIDDQSRQEWLQTRAKGIDMLGFKLEEPRGDLSTSSAPLEGMATVRHPLLTEAVIRFQSNAGAELLPPTGPAKIRNDAPSKPPDATDPVDPAENPGGLDNDGLAEALEKDFNHYLTVIDKGYRADTDRMLFLVGFGGAGFKKVYHDPIRRMPISRSVDAADIIVSNDANDIDDAGRITHKILMRHSTFIRMQISGVYRRVGDLATPSFTPNVLETKISAIQGFTTNNVRPEDNPHTIYECYAELDIKGYEHKDEGGEVSGLHLPYRITIEKDSEQLLEIRRNWRQDDENCLPKRVFVKYPFVPAFGFYEIGLLQILGNANRALTAAWREMLDSGMFANFPGFLYASGVGGRQNTNEFRVPPGGGVPIQTGGKPISDIVMKLPYNDITPGLAGFVEKIEQVVQRLAGTAEVVVGEGRQDAPVGTTLAMIEQATKMLAAVHIRLHAAQSEEFQLLKELFREDPEAFWRNNKRPAHQWRKEELMAALENSDIVPAADPNTPSHMHRIMKAVALKQLQAMNPQLYDAKAVDSRIMRMIGIADPSTLFAPPAPPGQDPAAGDAAAKMAEIQAKKDEITLEHQARVEETAARGREHEQDHQARATELVVESKDRAADRASRERVAAVREYTEAIKSLTGMAEKGLIDPQMAAALVMEAMRTMMQTMSPTPPQAAIPPPHQLPAPYMGGGRMF